MTKGSDQNRDDDARTQKERAPNHLWKPAFLKQLAICGVEGRACEKAEISRSGVRDARESDAEFAAAYLDAQQTFTDSLEEEAGRRALHGDTEEVYNREGDVIGSRTKKSDDLMKFLLTKRRYPNSLVIDTGEGSGVVARAIARAAHEALASVPEKAP